MLNIKSLIAVALLSCVAATSFAQGPAACKEDVTTLCKGVKPGGGRIAACMKDHKDQVSAECKEALKDRRSGQSHGFDRNGKESN